MILQTDSYTAFKMTQLYLEWECDLLDLFLRAFFGDLEWDRDRDLDSNLLRLGERLLLLDLE